MKTYKIQVTEQHGYIYHVEAEDKEQALDKYYDWSGVTEIRNERIDEFVHFVEEVND